FHLAAYNHVGDSFTHVQESILSNMLATANLMEAGLEYERFIYIASSEVYGFQESVPFTESSMPFPISPYAIGKYGGELYAKMKRHQTNKQIICLRPFNTFGPYQSERAVIPEFIIKCLKGESVELTEGTQTREFNFVENIVGGMLLATGVDPVPIGSINLGSGEEIAIRDLVQRIHELTGSQSELRIGALENRPTEIWRMQADFLHAEETLGWKSGVGFDEGLRRTVDWYRKFLDVFGSAGLAGL
ncbi:MAG: GDP-mannose 4,6-dehydratase, partial [Verrucomicrobiota bacterium]|nr:GDP-mannose 4,6-dehydratase [Verrucomicrobiota bacterium]